MSWFRRNSTSPRRWWSATHREAGAGGAARRRSGTLLIVVALGGMLGGCSDQQLDSGARKVFAPRRTPQQSMVIAVSHEDADERRRATAEVAKSRQAGADWAVKGFIAIALLETDAQGRCVAIRALGRTGDPRAVDTMLKILNFKEEPESEVRPPEALCRWEAMSVLANAVLEGRVEEGKRDKVQKTLTAGLASDSDRQVRDAAARGLGGLSNETAVTALIAGLEDADFAVIHRCEEGLVKLTGVTHHCDPAKWQTWFAANRGALFASAGQVPESRRPPYGNRWEKANYDMRQMWDSAFPGGKER